MLTQKDFFHHKTTESFLETLKSKLDPLMYEEIVQSIHYEKELQLLQAELVDFQQWVAKTKRRVCILFEGRDASGKGGEFAVFRST